ncbi:MAG: hypothetical protein K6F02_00850 [Prevotella sp.]|nr:hypothetical protein [Prevotella sp.]
MRIGERVIVDAAVTGDGVHHHGVIDDIYDFARTSYYSVRFDEPDGMGRKGTTVTNPGLIRKEAVA